MSIEKYLSDQIKRAVIQILETIYIIQNSKNTEIIIKRYDFLMSTIPILESNCNDSEYFEIAKEGYLLYRNAYPERTPSDIALIVIEKPNIKLNEELYCISLYNSVGKQFQEFVEVTKTLKQESAKVKRKQKLLESITSIKNEILQKCQNATSFQVMNEAVIKLENTIKNRESFDDLILQKQ